MSAFRISITSFGFLVSFVKVYKFWYTALKGDLNDEGGENNGCPCEDGIA